MLIYRTYAVEGFGEACLLEISIFLVVCAGKAGTYHQCKDDALEGVPPSKPPNISPTA
jgi:hypothetical protein